MHAKAAIILHTTSFAVTLDEGLKPGVYSVIHPRNAIGTFIFYKTQEFTVM